jgi:nicotinamide-nucleotide amidase
MKRPALRLVDTLRAHQLRIAFVESITCGLAAHTIGSVPNTSEVFMGSIVCYDENVKKTLLKVPASLIKKHTAESAQVTARLARNLQKLIDADIHVAVTGLAAAGGSETKTKPVGTVFFAMQIRGKMYQHKVRYRGTPLQVKKKAVEGLFKFIVKEIRLAHPT